MSFRKTLKQFAVALGVAAISSLFATSISSAQTTAPAVGSLVVRVENPTTGARVNGAVTFTGAAVDCVAGQAATRVAVYDGTSSAGVYLADVSMEAIRPFSDACGNRPGSAQFGFRLILDSNRISDGRHTLAFVAQYPSGMSQTVTTEVTVQNYVQASYGPAYTYATNYSALDQSNYWIHNDYYRNCYSYYLSGGCGYAGVVAPYYNYGSYYNSSPYYNVAPYYNTVPIYTTGVYRPCVVNPWGNCSSYMTYPTTPYSVPAIYPTSPYYWNGYTWIRRY